MSENRLEGKIKKRRFVVLLCMFLIILIGLGVLCLKSSYFNINTVLVENNNIVTIEEIQILSEAKEKNIFLINKSRMENKIKTNPYIDKLVIKRKLPSTLIIDVKEKEIKGIYQLKETFINVDKEGKMVHAVNKFPNGKLPLIEGVVVEQYVPNESLIKNDELKLQALKSVLCITDYNETKNLFYSINVADPYGIILKTMDGINVKIGDATNLEYKLSLALPALRDPRIKGMKGMLEIEPNGKAVFRKQ